MVCGLLTGHFAEHLAEKGTGEYQPTIVWLPKTYEPYTQGPDSDYYLGLGKTTVLEAKWDMLGDALLNNCSVKTATTGLCEPTWARVERALPVMRYSQGNKAASGNQFMCSPVRQNFTPASHFWRCVPFVQR